MGYRRKQYKKDAPVDTTPNTDTQTMKSSVADMNYERTRLI